MGRKEREGNGMKRREVYNGIRRGEVDTGIERIDVDNGIGRERITKEWRGVRG